MTHRGPRAKLQDFDIGFEENYIGLRRYTSGMPKCIFSEDEAGSKEHIWPQWLLARKDFGDFRLKRAGASEVILKNGGQLIVKSVS